MHRLRGILMAGTPLVQTRCFQESQSAAGLAAQGVMAASRIEMINGTLSKAPHSVSRIEGEIETNRR